MSPYKLLQQKVTKQKMILLVKQFVIISTLIFLTFIILNLLFPLRDSIEYSTLIRDNEGTIVNGYLTHDEKWRMKTELSEISPLLRKTIIAKEDKYFYRHPGINMLAVVKAVFNNLLHLKTTSGASTITMQVAKALDHHQKRSLTNKLIETFRAFQLEWKYSKDEILQLYCNIIPYGGNIEGVKAAALLYFKKNPDHLSLAEITALSIIPNRPSSLIIGKNNNLVVQQRNKWLQRFSREKLFTVKEIEDALSEPLTAQRETLPHFIPHLAFKLKKLKIENNITTTILLNTQLKIEKLTKDYINAQKFKNINNASVIIIDNQSHEVITYIGSASFNDTTDGGQVNGANAVRQPGSTLKPLLYGICMDEGLLTPKTILNDVPVNYRGYAPENYDKKFNGFVSVENALEHSLNIPAVKSLQSLGIEKLISKLITADFKQIKADHNKLGLSMILGGCGTTLEQLTGLFSSFANNGTYSPIQFTKPSVHLKRVQLISPAASYLITDILSKVARPDFPINWQATERMPKIAWKTGTSYGRKDAWSIGYNIRYTVGVWVGNFSGLGIPELSGANTATPLLFKIFNTIDYQNDADWFQLPKELEQRKVCSETGLVPGPYCTSEVLDYYIPLISSTKQCQHIQELKVSPDSSMVFCEVCAPASGYVKKLYRVLSPEMQDYYISNSIAFQKIPPHNPNCDKLFKGEGPVIISPANGTEYFINNKDPEPIQLLAHTSGDVTKVYWYINDVFY
ncbi:MAG TPA: penicillin-binding protein 1C, partial [Flavisolibacter sp.]|nr:penicillin-binding protein 1C [Flavisolibacter sp.]